MEPIRQAERNVASANVGEAATVTDYHGRDKRGPDYILRGRNRRLVSTPCQQVNSTSHVVKVLKSNYQPLERSLLRSNPAGLAFTSRLMAGAGCATRLASQESAEPTTQ
jgi:hypothetical protein